MDSSTRFSLALETANDWIQLYIGEMENDHLQDQTVEMAMMDMKKRWTKERVASFHGQSNIVVLLLDSGADVNIQDVSKFSLHL